MKSAAEGVLDTADVKARETLRVSVHTMAAPSWKPERRRSSGRAVECALASWAQVLRGVPPPRCNEWPEFGWVSGRKMQSGEAESRCLLRRHRIKNSVTICFRCPIPPGLLIRVASRDEDDVTFGSELPEVLLVAVSTAKKRRTRRSFEADRSELAATLRIFTGIG
eukprot:scaffold104181_cov28-Tisochrysis_lutea.AAC.3